MTEYSRTNTSSPVEHILLCVPFGVLLFSWLVAIVFAKWLVLGVQKRTVEAVGYQFYGWKSMLRIMHGVPRYVVMPFVSGTWVMNLVYKMMGCKVEISPDTIIFGKMFDQDMVTVGKGAIINKYSFMAGHQFNLGALEFGHTVIGSNATIEGGVFMMCSCEAGPGTTISMGSSPFPGQNLKGGTFEGAPCRCVGPPPFLNFPPEPAS